MPKHVLAKLEKELKDIKQALLVEIPQEIARAAGQGDLSENAEYEQALAKRDMFQNKLVTLEKRIAEVASLDISRLPKSRAAYGSKITILDLDSDEEFTYTVGQEEGNEVRVQIPAGIRRFEILELKTIHDVA
ncbi:MAG: Transcription elongation factor [Holophagaceae bacterium]|nr:Transcription elongation factor [Holophagaceae bacterium]